MSSLLKVLLCLAYNFNMAAILNETPTPEMYLGPCQTSVMELF